VETWEDEGKTEVEETERSEERRCCCERENEACRPAFSNKFVEKSLSMLGGRFSRTEKDDEEDDDEEEEDKDERFFRVGCLESVVFSVSPWKIIVTSSSTLVLLELLVSSGSASRE
jgi:hypothetical protein